MNGCFDNPASLELLPSFETQEEQDLLDLGVDLQSKAAALAGRIHPLVIQAVGDLVRGMNCYYSNLIEGSDTLPKEIAAALKADFSIEPGRRDLQLEAVAHIAVQLAIDQGDLDGLADDFSALAREIHRRFYGVLPPAMQEVRDPTTNAAIATVTPGAYRTRNVEVGRHVPVAAEMVPSFMHHLAAGYAPVRRHIQPVAVAAAHHRLLWVHPFLDGNGRVARLISHAGFRKTGVGSPLWSIARGLARNVMEYKTKLAQADDPPQGALDGCGTLSRRRLVAFCRFFLTTAIDQVDFMAALLQPEALSKRLSEFVRIAEMRGELDPRVETVLQTTLMLGELPRAKLPSLLGVTDRQARRLIEPVVTAGLLVAPDHRKPYRLAFPLDLSERLFPPLFRPSTLDRP